MTNSTTGWIAKEVTFELNTKTYRLSRFSRKYSDAFVDWAKNVLPNPVDELLTRISKFPHDLQISITNMITKMLSCKMTIDSPEVAALFYSQDGHYKTLMILLQANHKDLNDDDAWQVIHDSYCYYGPEWFFETLNTVMGRIPDLIKKKEEMEKITGLNTTNTDIVQIPSSQTSS
jgi:hypothetical protein